MATIDKALRVRWRPRRHAKFESVSVPTAELATAAKALAEAHKHRISAADVYRAILGIDQEDPPRPPAPTLTLWATEWFRRKTDIEPSTRSCYRSLLNRRILPALGRQRLTDIDRDVVLTFVANLAGELKPASIRKIHGLLHQILGDAVPKHIAENPASKPTGNRRNGLPRIRRYDAAFLTSSEADILLRECPKQIKDLVRLALLTGMRLGELLGLRACDADLDAATPVIYVRQALKRDGSLGPPKSEASTRPITIGTRARKILRRRLKNKAPHSLVFTAPGGGAWDACHLRNRFWNPAVAAARRRLAHPPAPIRVRAPGRTKKGRPPRMIEKLDPLSVSTCDCATRLHQRPRFHDLRHTHVDWLLEARWDLQEIQLRIGHESFQTTYDIYGPRRRRANTARLDALDKMMRPPDRSRDSKKLTNPAHVAA